MEAARVSERARVTGGDFGSFVAGCKKEMYDIIFLDPPYGGKILGEALRAIERFDILSRTGIIVCESFVDDSVQTKFSIGRTYRYGTVQIMILSHQQENGTNL